MPEPPQHQLPARPTSLEVDVQRAALTSGGKNAEVLVKAARDLIVLSAVYDVVHAPSLVPAIAAARSRFQQYAVLAGIRPLDLVGDEARTQAALVLTGYLIVSL